MEKRPEVPKTDKAEQLNNERGRILSFGAVPFEPLYEEPEEPILWTYTRPVAADPVSEEPPAAEPEIAAVEPAAKEPEYAEKRRKEEPHPAISEWEDEPEYRGERRTDYREDRREEYYRDYREDFREDYRRDYRPGYREEFRPGYRENYRRDYRPHYARDYTPLPDADEFNEYIFQYTHRRNIVIALIAAGVFTVTAGGYFLSCSKAEKYAEAGDFVKADAWLVAPSPDSRMDTYIKAGLKFQRGDYAGARAGFAELSGFLSADSYAQESTYLRAGQLASAGNLEQALQLYDELAVQNYKDAADLSLAVQFETGKQALYEKGDYPAAVSVFQMLKSRGYADAGRLLNEANYAWAQDVLAQGDTLAAFTKFLKVQGYADADDIILTLQQDIYAEGQRTYRSGQTELASRNFQAVSGFERSDGYLSLIRAKTTDGLVGYYDLIGLIGFEDTNDVLLSTPAYALRFLTGEWVNADRGKSEEAAFIVDADGLITDNLPAVTDLPFEMRLEDSTLYVSETPESTLVADKFFEIVDYNTIQVFCLSDGSMFTLERRLPAVVSEAEAELEIEAAIAQEKTEE